MWIRINLRWSAAAEVTVDREFEPTGKAIIFLPKMMLDATATPSLADPSLSRTITSNISPPGGDRFRCPTTFEARLTITRRWCGFGGMATSSVADTPAAD